MQEGVMQDKSKQKKFGNDIAIIGMACRFPGAKNTHQFWDNLLYGRESITFFSDEELENGNEELIKDPNFVRAGSILEDVKYFDAQFFGFSEYEASILDPQHRKFLECSWEALEDGGYGPYTLEGSTGIFAGSGFSSYFLNNVHPSIGYHPNRTFLESMNELQLLIANDRDYLATRVAYKLNLRGPSINVQTACSTALVAVHLACENILNGTCDMALAGAVTILCSQKTGYLYQQDMIFSPDGHCRPFDAEARGTVFGSGVGVVLLKKLTDAIRDGDTIHAVIKGTAVNNDGLNKVGYSAPSVEGQASVMAEALVVAGLEPKDISFIEGHGTATQVGDLIEIAALKQVFKNKKRHSCVLGGVKSNVGHLGWAAGMAGLFKVVLALKHGYIPPTLHFKKPNPQARLDESPFYTNTKTIPWPTNDLRIAGVSSFGLGGTNAHIIVAEPPLINTFSGKKDKEKEVAYLCTISARNEQAVKDLAKRYLDYLNNTKDISLLDFCYTTNIGRSHFEKRFGFISSSISDLKKQLDEFLKPKPISEYKKIRNEKEKSPYKKDIQKLVSLRKIYESGKMPDWNALYANKNVRRLHLPTYPFQQQKYWIEPKQLPTLAKDTPKTDENWSKHFYEILYKKQPKYGNASKYFPTIQHLKKSIDPKLRKISTLANIEYYQDKLKILDNLSCLFIINAFYKLGFTFKQKNIHIDDFITKFNILPKYKKLIRLFFEVLDQEGVFRRNNDNWEVVAKPNANEVVMQNNSNDLAEFELLNRCGPKLAEVLRGEINPLHLLFPNGDIALLKKLYTESPTLKAMNMIVAELLHELQNNLPKKTGIKILEIGGGTGSTTASILKKISPRQTLYTFTDISNRFISDAKTTFSDDNFMSYLQLDIEKDPANQGFKENEFDVVVASNILHATKDLKETLSNVKKLLAPKGILILVEGTMPVRWVDTIFGLTDGWWRFSDYELRKDYPLLPTEKWGPTLQGLGFHEISTISSEYVGSSIGARGGLPQAVIIAKYIPEPIQASTENVIIFADNSGVSDSLITKFEANNKQCIIVRQGENFKEVHGGKEYIINPYKSEEFEILFDRIKQPIEKVLYLWALNIKVSKDSSVFNIKDQCLKTCSGLLNAVKSIVSKLANPPKLFVITQGVQILDKQSNPNVLVQAAVCGMCRVIAIEHPELSCKVIDIESREQTGALLEEVLTFDQESQIVLQKKERYVMRLSRKKIDTFLKYNHVLRFRDNGVYVVTGGLGGLGLKVTEWMSQAGAKHIVLIGRNPTIDSKTSKKLKFIKNKGANAHVVKCDVSDYKSLKKLFKDLKEIGTIKGIIHAAGTIDDGIVLQQNIERFLTTTYAKVLGSWNLHTLSIEESMDLDFFVMFSSIVSTIGNVGQSNHASANSFMNSLMSYRKSLNLPSTVIQWGAWSSIGTLSRYPEVVEKLKVIGINLIQPEDGIKALDFVLRTHTRSALYAPIDWKQFINSNKLNNDPFFCLLKPKQHKLSQKEQLTADDFLSRFKYLSYSDKVSFIRNKVLQHIKQILGLKENIGEDEDFFDYGMDSLTSIQLRNNLQSEFKCSLHPTITYKYPSVRKLVKYLIDVLQNNTSKPTVKTEREKQFFSSNKRPISMQQKRWLLLAKKNYGRLLIPIMFYTGLDKKCFRSALEQVILRHEVLRYKFSNNSAVLVDINEVLPSDKELFIDADNKEKAQIIKQQAEVLRASPPDPTKRPAWTIRCIKLDQGKFLVLLHIQHLEFDGTSVSIFVDDLRRIYSDLIKGIDAFYLPPVQYSDYVNWQSNYMNSDMIVKDRLFFKNLFSDVNSPTLLPNHSGRKSTESYPSACYTPKQIKDLWENLQLVGKKIKASPFAILCATYGQFIGEITGQNQVIIGTIVSSRPSSKFDRTIGPFVQPFPLKILIVNNLKEMILNTHDLITEINDRSRYPVADMVRHISTFKGMNIDTYFTDPFIMLNNYPRESNIQPRVEVLESLGPVIKEELSDLTSKRLNEIAGLFLIVDFFNKKMRFNFWYHLHRFTETQVQNWAERYLYHLLKNIRRL